MAVLGLRFCVRVFSSCGKRGHSSSRCAGLPLSQPLLLRSTDSRRAGSVIVAHGPSCSAVCGILPDQGLNPCPLHWQADSQPLRHQGSPVLQFLLLHSSNSVTSLGSTSNSSSLAISTTAVVTSSTEDLNPSKSSMRLESSSKLLLMLIF